MSRVSLKNEVDFSKITKIYLALGSQCNMCCRHCSQTPIKSNEIIVHNVSDDVWCLLDNYIRYAVSHKDKTRIVVFWGGEPLLHWNFIKEVVTRYTDKFSVLRKMSASFLFTFTTNGLLLTDDKIDFINQHFIKVLFSYDAPYPFAVRGKISDAVIQQVYKLKRYAILTSFNALNTDYYLACRCLHKKFPMVRHSYNFNFWHMFTMPEEIYTLDIEILRKNIRKLVIASKMGDTDAWSALNSCLWGTQYPGKSLLFRKYRVRGCFSGTNIVSVKLNGDVLSCYNSSEVIGSINDSLDDIFKNSLFAFVNRKSSECETCRHNDICTGNCSFSLRDEEGKYYICEKYMKVLYDVLKEESKNLLTSVSEEEFAWFMEEYKKDDVFVSNF